MSVVELVWHVDVLMLVLVLVLFRFQIEFDRFVVVVFPLKYGTKVIFLVLIFT